MEDEKIETPVEVQEAEVTEETTEENTLEE